MTQPPATNKGIFPSSPTCSRKGCHVKLDPKVVTFAHCPDCRYRPGRHDKEPYDDCVYCSPEHQREDVEEHRAECEQRKRDRLARRLGFLVCDWSREMRREFFNKVVTNTERIHDPDLQAEVLVVHMENSDQPRDKVPCFPAEVSEKDQRQICNFERCVTTVEVFTLVLEYVQAACKIRISEVVVEPRMHSRMRVVFHHPDGGTIARDHAPQHVFFLVHTDPEYNAVLPDYNKFPIHGHVIDPTYEQFGFKSGSTDAREFAENKVKKLVGVHTLGTYFKNREEKMKGSPPNWASFKLETETSMEGVTLDNVICQSFRKLGDCSQFLENTTATEFHSGRSEMRAAVQVAFNKRGRQLDAIHRSGSLKTIDQRACELGMLVNSIMLEGSDGHAIFYGYYSSHMREVFKAQIDQAEDDSPDLEESKTDKSENDKS